MMRSTICLMMAATLLLLSACTPAPPPATVQGSSESVEPRAGSEHDGDVPDDPPRGDDSVTGPAPGGDATTDSALAIFEKRILPIFRSPRPSSCTECHLSGVELKDYIRADQQQTFASLVAAGLIDVERPGNSKILTFIRRQPKRPSLVTDKVRKQESEAFAAWIQAAVKDPELLASKAKADIGPSVPDAVIRHARTDRVLASFVDNVWTEVARCSGCHSPAQNRKQVKEHGERVSWIKLDDPQATLDYMLEADLIDTVNPDESLLLQKPTLQVEHGGGQKMLVGDRTYRQFRRFIDDYATMVDGQYKAASDLPATPAEISMATSMTNGTWFKLEGVPAKFDKKLLQVDLFRREGQGWSKTRWATADRGVAGKAGIWQQTLSLTAGRGSPRAREMQRTRRLPPGEYLAKVYIDADGRLDENSTAGLGKDQFVGQVTVTSQWPTGYGRMTVARFPRRQ